MNRYPFNCSRRVALAAIVALFSAQAYASCPPQYQESWVAPQFANATAVLNQSISAVDAALSAQLMFNSQRLTSAIAILTKQKALAANQISDANRTAADKLADSLGLISKSRRIAKARFDYGGEFGQGDSPCKVFESRQVISNRDRDMKIERRERVISEVIAAPGRYADPVKGLRQLIDDNKASCTQDQVDSGLCAQVGSTPGASLTIATLFEPAMEGEAVYDAKVALINNMVGLPDGPTPVSSAKSPATAAYSLAKAKKDALISPAIVSLKEIQLDYSGVAGSETGTDLPLAVHFRNQVKRYSGNSPEYDAWSKVMVAQNERGALVELLKIKALDLAIQEKQYRQYERMEAQLAALVAMNVQALSASADNAADDATKQNVSEAIK